MLALLALVAPRAEAGREWKVLEGHTEAINCVAFSPDGKRLASASYDGSVRLWDVATGKELFRLDERPRFVGDVVFTPDGKRLITCSSLVKNSSETERAEVAGVLTWWDLRTRRIARQKRFPFPLFCFALSPDGKVLVTGSGYAGNPDVKLRDGATGEELATLAGGGDPCTAAFSPDGKLLAVGHIRHEIRLWDVAARKLRARREAVYSNAVAFAPDSKAVAVGGGPEVTVYDLRLRKLKELPIACSSHDEGLAYSPDGKLLAGVEGWFVSLREVATGRNKKWWQGHDFHHVNCLRFSPDGKLLATGGDDKTIRLWRLPIDF